MNLLTHKPTLPTRCHLFALALSAVSAAAISCSGVPAVDDVVSSAAQLADDEPSAPKASWTRYGFDARNSQVNPNETILGPNTVGRLKERWRLHMPDGATSTPAIVDDVAYFGGWNGHVYAAKVDTGEILWQRRVTQAQVNSTPLVTADRIYVTAGASLVALARADGAVLYDALLDTHPSAMLWSSPKPVDDLLIIGVASFENGISLAPTFVGSVVAVDAESGDEVWRVVMSGDSGIGPCSGAAGASVWSSAAFDEELGLVYIGTGQGFTWPVSNCSDALFAIDYRRDHPGERVRWFVQYTAEDVFGVLAPLGPDADVGAAPNLFEVAGRKLVGAGDKGASYRVFDRETGEAVWRTDLEIGPLPSFGGVTTTAAVHDGTIYVASNHLETAQWVADGTHDPNEFSYLYALDTADGHERWRVRLPSPMAGSFAVANGVLYHAIVNRTLYARALDTGDVLWSTELQNDPGAGPSVVDGRVFVSAGMVLTAVNPTERGGFVSMYTLDAETLIEREAQEDPLEVFSGEQCQAERAPLIEQGVASAACNACLCECDATAAGHCGSCTTLASCAVLFCGFSADADEIRECLAAYCDAKLLPSFVFERAVELTPCMTRCAFSCGF
ncbi:MAG: PQQ-binding-like beta-propeller repeat protein [Polyangiales bacterium]